MLYGIGGFVFRYGLRTESDKYKEKFRPTWMFSSGQITSNRILREGSCRKPKRIHRANENTPFLFRWLIGWLVGWLLGWLVLTRIRISYVLVLYVQGEGATRTRTAAGVDEASSVEERRGAGARVNGVKRARRGANNVTMKNLLSAGKNMTSLP